MAKCIACYRESANKFCKYHEQAYDSLKESYRVWCNAYGKMTWNAYLEKLLKLKQTGVWVKEVIVLELKTKEKKRV